MAAVKPLVEGIARSTPAPDTNAASGLAIERGIGDAGEPLSAFVPEARALKRHFDHRSSHRPRLLRFAEALPGRGGFAAEVGLGLGLESEDEERNRGRQTATARHAQADENDSNDPCPRPCGNERPQSEDRKEQSASLAPSTQDSK
jgi:hypothetical protein